MGAWVLINDRWYDMDDTVRIGDITVPRIGFGTLYITQQRGFGAALPEATQLLNEAVRLGVRFFDTADSYGNGAAEEALREALFPYDGLLIATKGVTVTKGWAPGCPTPGPSICASPSRAVSNDLGSKRSISTNYTVPIRACPIQNPSAPLST